MVIIIIRLIRTCYSSLKKCSSCSSWLYNPHDNYSHRDWFEW